MTGQVLDHDWFPGEVPANVSLGGDSWLYSSFAFIHYRSTRPLGLSIGRCTGVYVGTMFDLGPEGECQIGSHGVIAGPVVASNHRVMIGDYALISYDVMLADSPFALPPGATSEHQGEGGDIVIGDNCWIGARATVLGGARLGEGVIVGAAAVVDFEVPAFAIVAGNPGRIVGSSPPRTP